MSYDYVIDRTQAQSVFQAQRPISHLSVRRDGEDECAKVCLYPESLLSPGFSNNIQCTVALNTLHDITQL